MSDLETLEMVRDDISAMLDMSRASLSANQRIDREAVEEGTALENGQSFPRSKILRAVTRHPFLTAATVATVWYVGPVRIGAIAAAGASALARNGGLIAPLIQQAVASGRLAR